VLLNRLLKKHREKISKDIPEWHTARGLLTTAIIFAKEKKVKGASAGERSHALTPHKKSGGEERRTISQGYRTAGVQQKKNYSYPLREKVKSVGNS